MGAVREVCLLTWQEKRPSRREAGQEGGRAGGRQGRREKELKNIIT